MLEVTAARNGLPTARFGSRFIHSPYDPRREAQRFVDVHFERPPDSLIVVGAELGYLAREISERFPSCVIASVGLCEPPEDLCALDWWPSSPTPLSVLLDRLFSDLDVATMDAVEWPASVQAMPEAAVEVSEEISRWISRRQASLLTAQAFGRLRLRNAFCNHLRVSRFIRLVPSSGSQLATAIVAAGPSLEDAIPTLAALRPQIAVWSTTSALQALAARGLVPDLVIGTDPGFYAGGHMRLLQREPLALAAPISGARIDSRRPLLPLDEGELIPAMLLSAEGHVAQRVPAHGTVTGSALLLAEALARQPVLIAGLDLAYVDLASHARPHLSHYYMRGAADRRRPLLTEMWLRAADAEARGHLRHLRSLDTYAEWFCEHASRVAEPPALLDSARDDLGMPRATLSILNTREPAMPRLAPFPIERPPLGERRATARRVLDRCRTMLRSSFEDSQWPRRLQRDRELQELLLSLAPRQAVALRTANEAALPDRRAKLIDAAEETLHALQRCIDE